MTDEDSAYLSRMKHAKEAPAVLKLQLVTFRSSNPKVKVFAFEGIDDKEVYSYWVRRITPGIIYEALICKTKSQVLQLMDIVSRDVNKLSDNLYFFVDRDFDDLQGRSDNDCIFLIDSYSIENYLVHDAVLDILLCNEFHCNAAPEIRLSVRKLFDEVYSRFLDKTKAINFRLFVASKKCIRRLALSQRTSDIAAVQLETVGDGALAAGDVVRLEREPTDDEIASVQKEFDALEQRLRYRGKFALLFFRTWLALLVQERNRENSPLFDGLPFGDLRARGAFPLSLLAAISTPPTALSVFLARIANGERYVAV